MRLRKFHVPPVSKDLQPYIAAAVFAGALVAQLILRKPVVELIATAILLAFAVGVCLINVLRGKRPT